MDATTPPHLIPENKWVYLSGMRPYYGKLVQLPRLKQLANMAVSGVTKFPSALFNLTSNIPGYSFLTGIGFDEVIRVKSEDTANGLSLGTNPLDPGFGSQLSIVGAVYANQIWYTSPKMRIRVCDGASVKPLSATYQGTVSVVGTTTTVGGSPIKIATPSTLQTLFTGTIKIEFDQNFTRYTVPGTHNDFVIGISVTSNVGGVIHPNPTLILFQGGQTIMTAPATPSSFIWGTTIPTAEATVRINVPNSTWAFTISGTNPPSIIVTPQIPPPYNRPMYARFAGDNRPVDQLPEVGTILDIQGIRTRILLSELPAVASTAGSVDFYNVGSSVSTTIYGKEATFSHPPVTAPLTPVQFFPKIGQKVRITGFQNAMFNGTFVVKGIPSARSFTYDLLTTPPVGNDQNIGVVDPLIDIPSAAFIQEYFDHLVVANCTFKGQYEPTKVRISGLYNFTDWTPTQENEADEFDLVISQSNNTSEGEVTGMEKLGETIFLYTQDTIHAMTYIGLPKVINVGIRFPGFGAMKGTLVSNGLSHFYFDKKWFNFYQFDGSSPPTPIGDEIVGFLGSISSTPSLGTPAIDFSRSEVSWTFSVVNFFCRLVYNWVNKSWYVNEFLVSPTTFDYIWPFGGLRPDSMDEATASFQAYGGIPIDTFSATNPNGRLYGNATTVYREATVGEVGSVPQSVMAMESKDFISPDLQRVLEVDRITIHADYLTSSGIDVFVSVRDNLQSSVVYTPVGIWTKFTPGGTISFKPMAGRVVRYKFVPRTDTEGLVFYSFTDNLFNDEAEK